MGCLLLCNEGPPKEHNFGGLLFHKRRLGSLPITTRHTIVMGRQRYTTAMIRRTKYMGRLSAKELNSVGLCHKRDLRIYGAYRLPHDTQLL